LPLRAGLSAASPSKGLSMAFIGLIRGRDRGDTAAGARRWALASGVVGLAANVLLVLFYVTAKPWRAGPAPHEWFGTANDWLTAVQYATLLPVVRWLRSRIAGDPRARSWSVVGLAAAGGVVLLQVLLTAGLLPFAVEIGPVALCIAGSVCWIGGISAAGDRTAALPRRVTWSGRLLTVGFLAGMVVFVVGVLVASLARLGPAAWVIAALPGFAVWCLLPGWTVLLFAARTGGAGTAAVGSATVGSAAAGRTPG
jgi:hypothetical protein